MEKRYKENLHTLRDELEFILACNDPDTVMDMDRVSRLRQISKKTYRFQQEEHPYLTKLEADKLCIKTGTLDAEERKAIENHAHMTYQILNQLPFPPRLANVPAYAAGHHERPDGKGYPNGLNGAGLPLQSRILAIADVFEALTAVDRPYKQTLRMPKVLEIMERMKQDNHIDAEVYDLFVRNRIYEKYFENIFDQQPKH